MNATPTHQPLYMHRNNEYTVKQFAVLALRTNSITFYFVKERDPGETSKLVVVRQNIFYIIR